MAGGLKYYAHNKEAELARMLLTDKGHRVETFQFSLEKALAGDPEHDIALKVDDHIIVHNSPEWELYDTVTISGEVKFPGTYDIERGERLSSLIERAGGFTDRAYLNGAVFTREMVRRLQQEQIDEMILRLERELLGSGITSISTAISAEEMQIRAMEIQQRRDFIAMLRTLEANGRMVIKLDDPERLKDTPFNVELEEGDNLVIPSDPQIVQVVGSVNNQVAFVYDKKLNVKKYIDLAGGYLKNADKKRVYVLKVDGTAVQKTKKGMVWNKDSMRWEKGKRDLDPGDTIIVPEKLERVAWMREIKDITQILFQLALATGVVIALF
jgi:protein involved in polysaccharide export with SLBB domain